MWCSAGIGHVPLRPPCALIDSSRFVSRQPSPRLPATLFVMQGRLRLNFRLTRGRTGANRRISQSFVTIVRDRGPGISDLPSILAGTYQSASGMGMGILGAKRLMDRVHIDTASEWHNCAIGAGHCQRAWILARSICKASAANQPLVPSRSAR